MASSIRWGILGAGRIASDFAAALAEVRGATLHAVASRTLERAERLARAAGAPRAHASFEALVADPGVDVVYVATPAQVHRAHALLALEAGKPVLCEKPFATTAADARAVLDRARALGLFCMEAMWMRFAPATRELERLLRAGHLGEPLALTASLGFRYERLPGDRLFDEKRGGGALLDLGVYPISLAVWLLGSPVRVQADAVFGDTVDEQVAAVLTFAGGAQAAVAASLRARLTNDAVVTGTEAIARLREPLYCAEALSLLPAPTIGRNPPPPGGLRRLARAPGMRWARALAASLSTKVIRRPCRNGLAREIEEVVACLREGRRESAVMPHADTVTTLEVVDAIGATLARRGLSPAVGA